MLTFFALAADRDGVSYYARDRIAVEVGLNIQRLDRALDLLLDADIVAHRPWRKGRRDGVWQILPVPQRNLPKQAGGSASAGDLLRDLGFMSE